MFSSDSLFSTDAVLILPNCKVSVIQPPYIEVDATSSNVTIPCTFVMDGCSSHPTTLWFRYFSHSHEDLCTPICANRAKFGINSSSLQIKDIGAGDIAVYFCGVALQNPHSPGSKQVGGGTTLVLRGQWPGDPKVSHSPRLISYTSKNNSGSQGGLETTSTHHTPKTLHHQLVQRSHYTSDVPGPPPLWV